MPNSKPESKDQENLDSINETNLEPEFQNPNYVDPNFDLDQDLIQKPKKKFSIGKLISLTLILICIFALGAGGLFAYSLVSTANKVIVSEDECRGVLDLKCLKLPGVQGPEIVKLKGEDEGRTNILLIGTDVTANLTDTIMIMSYFYKEKKVVTLNIPRDTFVSTSFPNAAGQPLTLSEKINAVYPYASNARPDDPSAGPNALANIISREFGLTVHYWAVSNFSALKEVVNELGGTEVNVDKAFTDCEFPRDDYAGPIRPCPKFEVGPQVMDGTRALIYARSRMSPDDGGDFARSRRQSIVIQAILKTAKNKGIFGNLNNIRAYLKIMGDNLKTNIQLDEMLALYKQLEGLNLDTDFLRQVWSTGNGIWCDGASSAGRGYHITYCDGKFVGNSNNSSFKEKATNNVQNLLLSAEGEKLFQAQTVVLGNQSGDTNIVYNQLINYGFENIIINNNYREIKSATAKSTEKITFYIKDPSLRDLFSKLSPKPKFSFELLEDIPADKVLPKNATGAQVIVWVESI